MQVRVHRDVTGPVHEHDGKILMQILHAGRYAYHPFNVAPSAIRVSLKRTPLGLRRKADTQLFDAALTTLQAPINKFKPRALSTSEVKSTIDDYAHCASLAKAAG